MMTVVDDSFTVPGKVYPLYFSAKCGSAHFPPKFRADFPALHT
jgi:hypothetical protein